MRLCSHTHSHTQFPLLTLRPRLSTIWPNRTICSEWGQRLMRKGPHLRGWEMLLGGFSRATCVMWGIQCSVCGQGHVHTFSFTHVLLTIKGVQNAELCIAGSYYVFCLFIIRQELMRTESHITRHTSLTASVCVCVCARGSHLESHACGSCIVLCRLWLTFNPWATICSISVCSQLFRRV